MSSKITDANNLPCYGLDAELEMKKNAKLSSEQLNSVCGWIERTLGGSVRIGRSASEFQSQLKNGQVLCRLANAIKPNAIPKINTGPMPFVQMENLNNFLSFCREYAKVAAPDLFMSVDLYEGKNIPQVLQTLESLSRKVGSNIAPKEASKHERHFTEEQRRQGSNIPSAISQGSTGGASQKGMGVYKRDVIVNDHKVDTTPKPDTTFTGGGGGQGSKWTGGSPSHHSSHSPYSSPSKPSYSSSNVSSNVSSSGGGGGDVDDLVKLADLKAKGIITEQEFAAKKKQILGL